MRGMGFFTIFGQEKEATIAMGLFFLGSIVSRLVLAGLYQGLIYAEVEFETKEDADNFAAPAWFTRDVSMDGAYHNSALSSMNEEQRLAFMTGVSKLGE